MYFGAYCPGWNNCYSNYFVCYKQYVSVTLHDFIFSKLHTYPYLHCRHSDDIIAYDCPLPIHKLTPAQQLQWNISLKTAEDIETAKINIDRLVNYLKH